MPLLHNYNFISNLELDSLRKDYNSFISLEIFVVVVIDAIFIHKNIFFTHGKPYFLFFL